MIKILFVCMGNICRSPAAEAIAKKLLEDKKIADKVICDSAGTISYHVGNSADSRMISKAKQRGYKIDSIARALTRTDFEEFDYILTMDEQNYKDAKSLLGHAASRAKLIKICYYLNNSRTMEVPDPYYGGEKGFDEVVEILEEACQNFIHELSVGL